MFKIETLFEDADLMKLAMRRNYCVPMQNATSFMINAGGRTLLIGIDFDPSKMEELSMHCVAANQTEWCSDGHSVMKEEYFIDSAVRLFEKQLREIMHK